MNYWKWFLTRLKSQLWWQAIFFGIFGVIVALAALLSEDIFPWQMPFEISQGSVELLLGIVSSSMLAVTTFSLGAMTTAFSGATSNVSPRATKFLMEDRTTHNVLSSFIGAFIFSVVALIVLQTGLYGSTGRAMLFAITILVIALIVSQLLRWVNHLISLGRVGNTISRLEKETSSAISERLSTPFLGGHAWRSQSELPKRSIPILSSTVGYIQFIDVKAISDIADEIGVDIWIPVNAGAFIYDGSVLAWADQEIEESVADKISNHFSIDAARSFEQDPRFGLAVMAEVASIAYDKNDYGTVIDVIGRQVRLLTQWSKGGDDDNVKFNHIHVKPLSDSDMFEDAFMPIIRGGADILEIQIRIQKALFALAHTGSRSFRTAASQQGELAKAFAEEGLVLEHNVERLRTEIRTLELAASEHALGNTLPAAEGI